MISIASFFVVSGVFLAIFVYFDTRKNRQAMTIMNAVWPLTMLWASWIGLAAYFLFGRQKKSMQAMDMASMNTDSAEMNSMDMSKMTKRHVSADSANTDSANMDSMERGSTEMKSMNMDSMDSMEMGATNPADKMKPQSAMPKWQGISLSTLHCGAGCTIADIIGESLASLFALTLIPGWTLDFFLALAIGVFFQYMAIQQMGRMQHTQAIVKAIKVDFFSLTAWQVGMYGFMGFYLAYFTTGAPSRLSFEFWFAMQIAMLAGFIIAYPMNKLLIHKGIKHAM